MRTALILALLWASILACGLIAGVYLAFSSFVMPALARIEPSAGVAAMNAINVDILSSIFMPLFFGATVMAVLLAAYGVWRWGEPGSMFMVAGAAIWLAGMFCVTVIFNVPLNDRLAENSQAAWATYLSEWTRWNSARCAASIISTILYALAATNLD